MGDTKFTPGPWAILELKASPYAGSIISKNVNAGFGDIICNSPEKAYEASVDNWEANAALIAASPDMYEALKGLLRVVSMDDDKIPYYLDTACAKAKAALSRATDNTVK